MTDWMIHLPFELRFVLIAGAAFALTYGTAWLIRRPLGRLRENIAVRIIAYVVAVWAAWRILTLVIESAPYLAGMRLAPIPVFILTPLIADLVRRRLSRKGAAHRTVVAATAAVFLLGAATVRLVSDHAQGEVWTGNLMISRYLGAHLWNEPSWIRIYQTLSQKLPDELDAALARNRGSLIAALRSGDKEAIDHARNGLIDDLFGIEMRGIDAVRRAPDTALVRYARAQRVLLGTLSAEPEACAAMAGLRPGSVMRGREFPETSGAALLERQLATLDAIALGRRSRNPARTPLSQDEIEGLRLAAIAGVPAAAGATMPELIDAFTQCTYAQAWWGAVLARPAPFVARVVAQIYPPLRIPSR